MKLLLTSFVSFTLVFAQTLSLEKLKSDVKSSFRGLSVVNQKIVWVSGQMGTVLKTINGGRTWDDVSVPNSGKTDFRDIEGFDSNTAIVMGIDSPAQFYKLLMEVKIGS